MEERAALLLQEYQEVNAHLRANTNQFVNWFSFSLTLSLLVAGLFVVVPDYRPVLPGFDTPLCRAVRLLVDAYPGLRWHFDVPPLHFGCPLQDRSHNPAAWLLRRFTDPGALLPMDDRPHGGRIRGVLLHLVLAVVPGIICTNLDQ